MRKINLFLTISCFISAFYANAQITITPSIDKAIQSAKEKSEILKNQQFEIEKIELQRKDVKQKYIPRIDASANYLYLDGHTKIDLETIHTPLLQLPIFDGSRSSDTQANIAMAGISTRMVLFSGLQIPYGAKALEQKRIGTEHLTETITDELIQEVIVSFDQIKVLEAVQSLIDESRKRLEVEEKRVERSIQEGFAIPLDRDKIRLAQLELQSKQLEVEGNKRLIYQKINYLTGYSDAEINEVANTFKPFVISENGISVENKAEIKALQSFVKAQEFLLKKEKGTYLPQIALLGGVRYTSVFNAEIASGNLPISGRPLNIGINEITLFPTWYVGVGVQWNIFSGFSRTNKIKQVRLDIASTESKLSDAEQKFRLLLNKNLENYRVANEKLQLNDQKVSVARNNLNIAVKQYEQGLIDISERLSIENDLYKAVIDQAQGIQQQRQSALEVMKTQGKLSEYTIESLNNSF